MRVLRYVAPQSVFPKFVPRRTDRPSCLTTCGCQRREFCVAYTSGSFAAFSDSSLWSSSAACISFVAARRSDLATFRLLNGRRCFHHSGGLVNVSFRVCAITWSRRLGLNQRPSLYESVALPLSYSGEIGAHERSRTVNNLLGRQRLYQLSYVCRNSMRAGQQEQPGAGTASQHLLSRCAASPSRPIAPGWAPGKQSHRLGE